MSLLCMSVYIYIYIIHIHVYSHIYIYIFTSPQWSGLSLFGLFGLATGDKWRQMTTTSLGTREVSKWRGKIGSKNIPKKPFGKCCPPKNMVKTGKYGKSTPFHQKNVGHWHIVGGTPFLKDPFGVCLVTSISSISSVARLIPTRCT